jgi:hypothetical protein
VANETSVAQVRSSFGATLGFSSIYNSYAADSSRTISAHNSPKIPGDVLAGYERTLRL